MARPAGISSKHALAIVNRGGATAAEVIALKEQIQHRVEEIWGIHLEPEPVDGRLLGFRASVYLAPQVKSLPPVLRRFPTPEKFLNKPGPPGGL